MNKAKLHKSRARRRKTESAQVSGPKPIILGVIAVFVVASAGWIGWNAWPDTQPAPRSTTAPESDTVFDDAQDSPPGVLPAPAVAQTSAGFNVGGWS